MHIIPPSSDPEPPEVHFTASLSADPTEIDAGGTVDFLVAVRNTGDDNIDGFEITNMGGATEANAEGVHAEDDRSVTISKEISESCDVSFVVIGRTGDESVSKETNSVHITVREAPETASPSVSAAQTQEASPEPSASTEASEAPAQAGALSSGIPADVLLIIIAVLLLAVVALIVVVILRGRKKQQ